MTKHPSLRPASIAAELATHHEGLSLEPYHDPVGFPTIGYGHLLSREKGADLSRFEPLADVDGARRLLEKDLAVAAGAVGNLIHVPLTQEQEAALIDFAFNCGAGNLQASTLRRVINREEHDEAPRQFRRWVWAGGRKLGGLIRRRREEAVLYAAGM